MHPYVVVALSYVEQSTYTQKYNMIVKYIKVNHTSKLHQGLVFFTEFYALYSSYIEPITMFSFYATVSL